MEPFVEVSLHAAVNRTQNAHLTGFFLDAVKDFDLWIREVIVVMFQKAGFDGNFLRLMQDIWGRQSIVTKLSGGTMERP